MKNIHMLLLCFAAFFNIRTDHRQHNNPANKLWALCGNSEADFSCADPVIFSTAIEAYEGSASVSNGGNLLFYTLDAIDLIQLYFPAQQI